MAPPLLPRQQQSPHPRKSLAPGRKSIAVQRGVGAPFNDFVAPALPGPGGKEPITLGMWMIKFAQGGVIVEGYRAVSANDASSMQCWRSTLIARRLDTRLVQTGSGSTYRLKGPMDDEEAAEAGIPADIIDAFARGFPEDWEDVVAGYYAELRKAEEAELQKQSTEDESTADEAPSILGRSHGGGQPRVSDQHERRKSIVRGRKSMLGSVAVGTPIQEERSMEEQQEDDTPKGPIRKGTRDPRRRRALLRHPDDESEEDERMEEDDDKENEEEEEEGMTPIRRSGKKKEEHNEIKGKDKKDEDEEPVFKTPEVRPRSTRRSVGGSANAMKEKDTETPKASPLPETPDTGTRGKKKATPRGAAKETKETAEPNEMNAVAIFTAPLPAAQKLPPTGGRTPGRRSAGPAEHSRVKGATPGIDHGAAANDPRYMGIRSAERKIPREIIERAINLTRWVILFVRGGTPTSIFPNFQFKIAGFREDIQAEGEWRTSTVERVIPPSIMFTGNSVYRLDGMFDFGQAEAMGFSSDFIETFLCGFPTEEWKETMSAFFNKTFEDKPTLRIVEVHSDAATVTQASEMDERERREAERERIRRQRGEDEKAAQNAKRLSLGKRALSTARRVPSPVREEEEEEEEEEEKEEEKNKENSRREPATKTKEKKGKKRNVNRLRFSSSDEDEEVSAASSSEASSVESDYEAALEREVDREMRREELLRREIEEKAALRVWEETERREREEEAQAKKDKKRAREAEEKRKQLAAEGRSPAVIDLPDKPSPGIGVLRTSRSGRTLRAPLADWAGQNITYDSHGNVVGVQGVVTESRHTQDIRENTADIAAHYGLATAETTPKQAERAIPVLAGSSTGRKKAPARTPARGATKAKTPGTRRRGRLVDYSDSEGEMTYLQQQFREIVDGRAGPLGEATPAFNVANRKRRMRRVDSSDDEADERIRRDKAKRARQSEKRRRHREDDEEELEWQSDERRRPSTKSKKKAPVASAKGRTAKKENSAPSSSEEESSEEEEERPKKGKKAAPKKKTPAPRSAKSKGGRKGRKQEEDDDDDDAVEEYDGRIGSLPPNPYSDDDDMDEDMTAGETMLEVTPTRRRPQRWTDNEYKRLKLAYNALRPETRTGWESIANSIGGGRTVEQCLKAAREHCKLDVVCREEGEGEGEGVQDDDDPGMQSGEASEDEGRKERRMGKKDDPSFMASVSAKPGTVAHAAQKEEAKRKMILEGAPALDALEQTDMHLSGAEALPSAAVYDPDDSLLDLLDSPTEKATKARNTKRARAAAAANSNLFGTPSLEEHSPLIPQSSARRRSSMRFLPSPKENRMNTTRLNKNMSMLNQSALDRSRMITAKQASSKTKGKQQKTLTLEAAAASFVPKRKKAQGKFFDPNEQEEDEEALRELSDGLGDDE